MPDYTFTQFPIEADAIDIDTLQANVENLQTDVLTATRDISNLQNDKVDKITTINGKDLSANRTFYVQDFESKNLLPNTGSSVTDNGITYTVNDDGSITANGTATANSAYTIYQIPASDTSKFDGCILTGCPQGGSDSTYRVTVQGTPSPWTNFAHDYGDGAVIEGINVSSYVFIRIFSGQTVSNLVFRPMIRLASESDSTYVPYAKTNVELTKLTQYDARYDSTAFTGYSKLPDGTLLEWGLSGAYASGNNKTMTVNLLVPFINSNYTVVTTGTYGGTDPDNYEVITTARRISASQFEIHCRNLSASYTNAVQWMAIGRWK